MFFLRLIINYYLDLYLCTGTWIFIINTGVANGCKMFLHLLHVFLALAILIFIVIILTLARSNNFVCIFLYLQRASLVGFLIFLFLILLFYLPFFLILFFFYLSFFVFLVLAFTSFLGSSPFSFFPSFFCCSLFLSRTSLCFFPVYSSHILVCYLCDCNNKSFCYFIYPAPLL